MGLSPWEDVLHIFMILIWRWPLTSRSNYMSSCWTCNYCLLWHWHTIFGTWVNYHERMHHDYFWSQYDVDIWPQGRIYRVFDMVLCSLAHESIIMGWCITYIHDLDLWPQHENYVFTVNFCLGKIVFDIGIPNLAYWCITMRHHVVVLSWSLYDRDLAFDLYLGGGGYA